MPTLACPECDKHFRVGDIPPGNIVTCTRCGARMQMPDRPLRKQSRVVGSIGGRSDYIDAEDFVAGTKTRKKKDRMNIVINNAFTVFLIVGTTALTILVLVGGGYILTGGGRGRNLMPIHPPAVVDVGNPEPAVNPLPPLPRDPEVAPDVQWQKFVGIWDAVDDSAEGKATRLEFTAHRTMVVSGHTRNRDGSIGNEVAGTRLEGKITDVQFEGDLIVVRYDSPNLATPGATRYRFGVEGELVAVLRPGTPEQREVRYRRKG